VYVLTQKTSLNKGNMGRVTKNIKDLITEWYGKMKQSYVTT